MHLHIAWLKLHGLLAQMIPGQHCSLRMLVHAYSSGVIVLLTCNIGIPIAKEGNKPQCVKQNVCPMQFIKQGGLELLHYITQCLTKQGPDEPNK